MPVSIRSIFAVVLWAAALTPPALIVLAERDPLMAITLWRGAVRVATALGLGVLGAGVLGLLLCPPFLPGLRLGWRRVKRRLTVDPAPLMEALGRLKHFENAEDHLTAGRVLAEQGKLREALEHLGRAVELDPERLAPRYELGVVLAGVNPETAARILEDVVRADERHAFGEALLLLGVCLERIGEHRRAAEALARHEELFGENRRALLHRGRALARLGDRETALELLRRAARVPGDHERLDPEDALARALARVELLRKGKVS